MSNHPYPEHVVEAVAEAMLISQYPNVRNSVPGFIVKQNRKRAEVALQALWDASRVGTLGQVDQLPDDAILWGADDMEHDKFTLHVKDVNEELHQALPAHVIFWGDSDA